MIKQLIMTTFLVFSISACAHDLDDMLNNKMTFDGSRIFQFPSQADFPDPECKKYANKKAVYSINYVKNGGSFEVLLEDVDGKSAGKDHLSCIFAGKQTIKWKAGKNVRYIKISMYSDQAKTIEGCASEKETDCDPLRDKFKNVHMLKAKNLNSSDVESFYYDVIVVPSNGFSCLTAPVSAENQQRDTCVLDPKLKIVR